MPETSAKEFNDILQVQLTDEKGKHRNLYGGKIQADKVEEERGRCVNIT